jgi:hypothetical protein
MTLSEDDFNKDPHYIRAIELLKTEILLELNQHPQGFPYTRDGMRLAIAALEDEVREVWSEWEMTKRRMDEYDPEYDHGIRDEALQVAAIAIQMVATINKWTMELVGIVRNEYKEEGRPLNLGDWQ